MADEQKVQTDHEAANEVIEALRAAAVAVKEIGDSHLELTEANKALADEADEADNARIQAEDAATEELESWRDSIDAFRLEIIDKDELLARTINH